MLEQQEKYQQQVSELQRQFEQKSQMALSEEKQRYLSEKSEQIKQLDHYKNVIQRKANELEDLKQQEKEKDC